MQKTTDIYVANHSEACEMLELLPNASQVIVSIGDRRYRTIKVGSDRRASKAKTKN